MLPKTVKTVKVPKISITEGWLWLAAGAVVAWRLVALFYPHPAGGDPPLVRIVMAPLGLWFLGWGLWSYRQAPGRTTLLLAGYGVTSGLHWGGAVGGLGDVGSQAIDNLLLAIYIVAAVALHASLLLHLALAFPPGCTAATKRHGVKIVVYLPVLAGSLLFVWLLLRPTEVVRLQPLVLLFLAASLWGVLAGIVWIVRLVRADTEERHRCRLPLVVGALLLGWFPYVALGFMPEVAGEYGGIANLSLILLPVALALALARPRGD